MTINIQPLLDDDERYHEGEYVLANDVESEDEGAGAILQSANQITSDNAVQIRELPAVIDENSIEFERPMNQRTRTNSERAIEIRENTPDLIIKEVLDHDNRSIRNGGIHFKVRARYIGETVVKPRFLLAERRNCKLLKNYLKGLIRTKSRRLRALHQRNPEIFTVLNNHH